MKKLLTIVAALLLTTVAHAQVAFKQFGISAEVGTTGVGINVSVPVVTDHLIISAGYNFPTFSYSQTVNVGNDYVNKYIGPVSEAVKQYKTIANQFGLVDPFNYDVETIKELDAKINAKVNFGNFKLMLQYYPTTQSSFYLTAGVFIGNGEMGTLSGDIAPNAWSLYCNAVTANDEIGKIPQYILDDLSKLLGHELPVKEMKTAVSFNVGDQTFCIRPEDNGHIDAKLKVNKVKPYVGLGFGNSVPQKHRLGFQMEVGAYYQSKPVLESDQEISFDSKCITQKDLADIKDMVEKFSWYPQLTFRFIGRIF